jgi:hypothetical protein
MHFLQYSTLLTAVIIKPRTAKVTTTISYTYKTASFSATAIIIHSYHSEKNYDYLKKPCMGMGFGPSMESGKQSKSFEMPKGGEK